MYRLNSKETKIQGKLYIFTPLIQCWHIFSKDITWVYDFSLEMLFLLSSTFICHRTNKENLSAKRPFQRNVPSFFFQVIDLKRNKFYLSSAVLLMPQCLMGCLLFLFECFMRSDKRKRDFDCEGNNNSNFLCSKFFFDTRM